MGLGSGIWKKRIPDPGVKKAPDPVSDSATLALTPVFRMRSVNTSGVFYINPSVFGKVSFLSLIYENL
jgi:hypothetical protein